MSAAEIIAQLSKLGAEERSQVFVRLCELQENDILHGVGPTETEKKIIDDALAEFERDGSFGTPWREVLGRLRNN